MNKQELIEILRTSLPSRRPLEVVNIGVVKVGDEFIVLKQRPNYEFNKEEATLYSEQHDKMHDYKEILAKTVIFDDKLISIRGRHAIEEYLNETSL